YETVETMAQIIVKEWQNVVEQVPVYEMRQVDTTDLVFDTDNLDLSIFDLQTITASNNIEITAGRDIHLEGNVKAFGEESVITIDAGRDVDVGRPEGSEPTELPGDVGLVEGDVGLLDKFTVIESGGGLQISAAGDV